MSHRNRLLALAATVLLAGCGSIGGPKIAIKVYAPPTQVRVDPSWPQVDWSLAIATTAGIEALDSPRIAVRPTPNELQSYKGAAWADTAPDLLRNALVEGFEESGRIASVTRIGGGTGGERSDVFLHLELRNFETDYGSGAPEAVVEVQARLQDRAGKGLATRRFRQVVAGASPEVPSMVDAFGSAMSALTTDVVGWTLQEGQRLDAAAKQQR